MDLKEQGGASHDLDRHWYYVSKGRAVRDLLGDVRGAVLLDVGSGSGVFARQLVEAGVAERAVCVDPNYTDEAIEAGGGTSLRMVREPSQADARAASLVTMMDVIEHVDDDAGLIARYAEAAAPGTRFLLTVPAFQALWSGHDEFLEHRRRYTTATLQDAVRAGGLVPRRACYFFGALFPAVAAARVADRFRRSRAPRSAMTTPPRLLNAALTALHDAERVLTFPRNRLAGGSAFCLAEKA